MAMLSTEDLRKVLDSGVFDAPIEAEPHIL